MVVTDISLLRYGMVAVLQAARWLSVCGETAQAPDARQICVEQKPELAVVDLELETGDALGLVQDLAQLRPGIRVLALSDRKDPSWVQRTFDSGAAGFLSKHDPARDLPSGLWQLYNGERYVGRSVMQAFTAHLAGGTSKSAAVDALSNRELAALRCVGEGQGPKKIAEKLRIAVTTVETHFSRIKSKLGLRSGQELKRAAARWALGNPN